MTAAAVNVRLPGGPASRGGNATHAAGAGAAAVGAAVAAAVGVPVDRVLVTRLIEEATGWVLELTPQPVGAPLVRPGGRRQRQLQGGAAWLPGAGPPLAASATARWRYVVLVSLAAPTSVVAPPSSGATAAATAAAATAAAATAAAVPSPLSASVVASRLLSPDAAPVWGELAASWAAASGQPSAAAVLAELAVVAPAPPAPGATPTAAAQGGAASSPGLVQAAAAAVWGGVAGALALLAGALVAVGYYARVVRPAKYRTGLDALLRQLHPRPPPGPRTGGQRLPAAHAPWPPAVAA